MLEKLKRQLRAVIREIQKTDDTNENWLYVLYTRKRRIEAEIEKLQKK